MKALSVQNPWAYFIGMDWKDIENRTWRTKYRGRLLIHVSRKIDPIYKEIFFKNRYELTTEQFDLMIENLNLTGCIIGEVTLVDVIENSKSIWAMDGQYHWVLKNAVMYEYPILQVKGKLGIWESDLSSKLLEVARG